MRREVLITGASVLNSVADDLDGFTAALREGRSGVRAVDLPAESRAGVAAQLDGFSVAAWTQRHLHDAPDAAARLQRATRRSALPGQTAACVAEEALRSAGLEDRENTALIVAGNNLALGYHAEALRGFHDRPSSLRPSHVLTHLDTDVVGTVSEATGVAGEGWTAGAASASSTVAAILGARLVAAGEVDSCLVVAPVAELSAAELRAFRDSGAMAAPDEEVAPWQLCRPFDAQRRGFVHGQGAAAIVLESRARVRPLASIAGWGQRLDARRGTDPNPAGQAAALRAALASARVRPHEVDYVNAHGTGSKAGDTAEAHALTEVFGSAPLVNSTKPLVGHCLTAAGLQELIATALQLRGGFVHGNPNLHEPIDEDLSLVGQAAKAAPIRLAVSNSVAFSGINAAIVLRS
ncbi:beta-ketoacyl synthase N-terminal-like domain-containing protein [Saccharopolyspora sp. NPDC002686]|uniref:beta-ketoacyl synthase N-terminal-like domain-containing protein n=1 Tax=Saccharopolyspora sp. NPDC002686 TaxID=3154541 RepID=UPI003328D3A6